MDPDDYRFLKDFFQNLEKTALDPTDPLYVPLYDHPEMESADPVDKMERCILWTSGDSVQLFSGFRGTGKSTQLRRLKKCLEDQGLVVVLVDLGSYLNLHTVIDVPDFLFAIAGGFGDALLAEGALDGDPAQRSYWTRFAEFLTRTDVELEELSFHAGAGAGAGLRSALRDNPSFRKKLQQYMGERLDDLVHDVREYVRDCVRRVRGKRGGDTEVVLLVDTVEQIRGTFSTANQVQESVEQLFASYADKLRFPDLHVVYTVPPYLKVRYPGIGGLYEPGGLRMLPAVKVRDRQRVPFGPGIDTLETVVRKRGDWEQLIGDRKVLDRLILESGGHLRDLIRILREIVTRAKGLPVSDRTVETALNQVRNEFLPLPDNDVRWLHRVWEEQSASLPDRDELPDFARFLDTHLILGYLNDDEWYDLHPLIVDQVQRQHAQLHKGQERDGEPAGRDAGRTAAMADGEA